MSQLTLPAAAVRPLVVNRPISPGVVSGCAVPGMSPISLDQRNVYAVLPCRIVGVVWYLVRERIMIRHK
jgi:hypothetical protein